MNTKFISIKDEYIRFLLFLYPTYCFTDSSAVLEHFIVKHDIKSKAERDIFDYHCDNGIVISSVIFDEVWNEEVLKTKAIEFARDKFHCRKRTLNTEGLEGEEFIDFLIRFIFLGEQATEESSEVLELFNLFGSSRFYKRFFEITEVQPVPRVIASIMTFLSKIYSNNTSIFYKKKHMVFASKLKHNFNNAYDSYLQRFNDAYGLSFIKFIQDLLI